MAIGGALVLGGGFHLLRRMGGSVADARNVGKAADASAGARADEGLAGGPECHAAVWTRVGGFDRLGSGRDLGVGVIARVAGGELLRTERGRGHDQEGTGPGLSRPRATRSGGGRAACRASCARKVHRDTSELGPAAPRRTSRPPQRR